MKVRPAVLVAFLGLLLTAIPQLAHAELKLAIIKVKGMVCSS
jgi:hypothetical protein